MVIFAFFETFVKIATLLNCPRFCLIYFNEEESKRTVLSGLFVYWPKSNLNIRDIARNVEEIEILQEIFRIVSGFPAAFRVLSRKMDSLWDSVLQYIVY